MKVGTVLLAFGAVLANVIYAAQDIPPPANLEQAQEFAANYSVINPGQSPASLLAAAYHLIGDETEIQPGQPGWTVDPFHGNTYALHAFRRYRELGGINDEDLPYEGLYVAAIIAEHSRMIQDAEIFAIRAAHAARGKNQQRQAAALLQYYGLTDHVLNTIAKTIVSEHMEMVRTFPHYTVRDKKSQVEDRHVLCSDLQPSDLANQDESDLQDMDYQCFMEVPPISVKAIKSIEFMSEEVLQSMTGDEFMMFDQKALSALSPDKINMISMDIGMGHPQHVCRAFGAHHLRAVKIPALSAITPECLKATGSANLFRLALKISKNAGETLFTHVGGDDFGAVDASTLRKLHLTDAQLQHLGTEADTNPCQGMTKDKANSFPRFLVNMRPDCLRESRLFATFDAEMIKKVNAAALEELPYEMARTVSEKVINAMPYEAQLVFFKGERCAVLENERLRRKIKPEVHAGMINCADQMPEGFAWTRPPPQPAATAEAAEPAATTAAPEPESSATSIAMSLASMAVCAAMAVAVAA